MDKRMPSVWRGHNAEHSTLKNEGAMNLGPIGNLQGGYKCRILSPGKKIIWRSWDEIPISDEVIKRVKGAINKSNLFLRIGAANLLEMLESPEWTNKMKTSDPRSERKPSWKYRPPRSGWRTKWVTTNENQRREQRRNWDLWSRHCATWTKFNRTGSAQISGNRTAHRSGNHRGTYGTNRIH